MNYLNMHALRRLHIPKRMDLFQNILDNIIKSVPTAQNPSNVKMQLERIKHPEHAPKQYLSLHIQAVKRILKKNQDIEWKHVGYEAWCDLDKSFNYEWGKAGDHFVSKWSNGVNGHTFVWVHVESVLSATTDGNEILDIHVAVELKPNADDTTEKRLLRNWETFQTI